MTVPDVLARRQAHGTHDDGARVALVVEGGGSRATFSAGMAAAVEDLGLTPLLDDVYVREVPMPFATILASPVAYHPMATDAATGASTDLAPLLDGPPSLRRALRASSTLPVLAGPPVPFADRRARATEALLDELAADGRVLHVRPPDDAPAVSRTSTDLGLLGEALRVGHEAAVRALEPLRPRRAPRGPTDRGTSRC